MLHLIPAIFCILGLSFIVTTISASPPYLNKKMHSNRTFIFDPNSLSWSAYENGRKVATGMASGGKNYCPDIGRSCRTIVGTFRIYSKKGPGCKSSRFPIETGGGAHMPYCMHFHKAGYAIHGAPDVPRANASHGCIRVKTSSAKWLSENFIRHGTTVVVRPYRN